MHLGQKVTVCPKLAAYRIPSLKELVDEARMDFVYLTPSETLRTMYWDTLECQTPPSGVLPPTVEWWWGLSKLPKCGG